MQKENEKELCHNLQELTFGKILFSNKICLSKLVFLMMSALRQDFFLLYI